jgi:hypothetical protein
VSCCRSNTNQIPVREWKWERVCSCVCLCVCNWERPELRDRIDDRGQLRSQVRVLLTPECLRTEQYVDGLAWEFLAKFCVCLVRERGRERRRTNTNTNTKWSITILWWESGYVLLISNLRIMRREERDKQRWITHFAAAVRSPRRTAVSYSITERWSVYDTTFNDCESTSERMSE